MFFVQLSGGHRQTIAGANHLILGQVATLHCRVVIVLSRRMHIGNTEGRQLCVLKTLSVLMTPRNHLSWRNDRAPVFRRGRLGLTIQVEDPA
jgi:hypothetical protein